MALLMSATLFSGCANKKPTTEQASAEDSITKEEDVVKAQEAQVSDINALAKPTFEQLATAREGSAADQLENLVYQYVSDNVVIDIGNLGVVSQETDPDAFEDIKLLIEEVNTSLKTGRGTNNVDDGILNYLLFELTNSPFTWKYDDTINPETGMPNSINIRGMDAATHLYFVDVTYTTDNNYKEVLPTSTIVRGSANEDALRQKLYTDYLTYISDAMDEYGQYQYDAKGYPVFTNGHSKWDAYAAKERQAADEMYNLIFGKKYDSVLYGWTSDADGKTEQVQYELYEDYTVDENGELLIVYRRKDTDEIVFDENNKPADFNMVVTEETTESTEAKVDDGSFEARWGNLTEIYMTQNNTTLLERLAEAEGVKDTLGVYTYPGLVESLETTQASITFRFVLEYAYNIGVNDYMSVRSVYLYDYDTFDAKDKLLEIYTTDDVRSKEVLEPFVESTINSYRKAAVSENHLGLNNIFVTYDKYDRYIADLNEYTYTNNGGFTFDIIGRKGDEIAVILTQRSQKRAKGTNMTYPTYLETSLVKLKLCEDDIVRIVSMCLLDVEIIGEPMSIIRDVTGVSSQIEFERGAFTESNQILIENCMAEFIGETIQYQSGNKLPSMVDIGVSDSTRESMKKTLETVASEADGATKAYVFIKNYPDKSNLYTSTNLRIVYVKDGAPVCEVNSEVAMINRNGKWGIVNYTVSSLLSSTTLTSSANSFVVITAGTPPTYEFSKRDDNKIDNTSNAGNDINIRDDELSWSEEAQTTTVTEVTDAQEVTEVSVAE